MATLGAAAASWPRHALGSRARARARSPRLSCTLRFSLAGTRQYARTCKGFFRERGRVFPRAGPRILERARVHPLTARIGGRASAGTRGLERGELNGASPRFRSEEGAVRRPRMRRLSFPNPRATSGWDRNGPIHAAIRERDRAQHSRCLAAPGPPLSR